MARNCKVSDIGLQPHEGLPQIPTPSGAGRCSASIISTFKAGAGVGDGGIMHLRANDDETHKTRNCRHRACRKRLYTAVRQLARPNKFSSRRSRLRPRNAGGLARKQMVARRTFRNRGRFCGRILSGSPFVLATQASRPKKARSTPPAPAPGSFPCAPSAAPPGRSSPRTRGPAYPEWQSRPLKKP